MLAFPKALDSEMLFLQTLLLRSCYAFHEALWCNSHQNEFAWHHYQRGACRQIIQKNYVGSETTPHINQGKEDTLTQRAVSLLHQGKGKTSQNLKGDKQSPAPDQDLESNWIFQECT